MQEKANQQQNQLKDENVMDEFEMVDEEKVVINYSVLPK